MRRKANAIKEIADLDEVKRFWTSILRDEEAKPQDRLKVSELLAKCEGGFDKTDKSDTPDLRNIDVVIKIVD